MASSNGRLPRLLSGPQSTAALLGHIAAGPAQPQGLSAAGRAPRQPLAQRPTLMVLPRKMCSTPVKERQSKPVRPKNLLMPASSKKCDYSLGAQFASAGVPAAIAPSRISACARLAPFHTVHSCPAASRRTPSAAPSSQSRNPIFIVTVLDHQIYLVPRIFPTLSAAPSADPLALTDELRPNTGPSLAHPPPHSSAGPGSGSTYLLQASNLARTCPCRGCGPCHG